MLALPPPLRALLLCTLLTTAHAIPPRKLFQRRDTCPSSDLKPCPSSLPDNFCCPSGDKCIALAGGTTALCCPAGASCARIKPLLCSLSLQDPEVDPEARVLTTALGGRLEECGEGCCPFGYSCNGQGQCVMDKDQSEAPPGASSTPSESAPAPTKTGGVSTPSSIPGDPADSEELNENGSSKPSTPLILGIVFGVLAVIAIIAALLIWRSKRRKAAAAAAAGPGLYPSKPSPGRSLSSSASWGNMISEPIAHHDAVRTDFIRAPESTRTAPSDRMSRLFRSGPSSPAGSTGRRVSGGGSVPPIRGMNSRWSCGSAGSGLGPRRQVSGESINVFAAPGTVGEGRRGTTFSEMMHGAGLEEVHRGRPFVPGDTPRI